MVGECFHQRITHARHGRFRRPHDLIYTVAGSITGRFKEHGRFATVIIAA